MILKATYNIKPGETQVFKNQTANYLKEVKIKVKIINNKKK